MNIVILSICLVVIGLINSNLATLHTISGGMDESWFYLITVAIEGCGARALPSIVEALRAVSCGQTEELTRHLLVVENAIADMTTTLMRMPENCDPYIFYNRVRIYFR